jgi:hypothetical protein
MNSDDLELVKSISEGTAAGATKSLHEIMLNLAGPASDELGQHLGERVREWRLEARALRIARRGEALIAATVKRRRNVPLKVLLPLLHDAALEDDSELQDCWASLLASAADGDAVDITPAYAAILKELTPSDAKLLDWIRHRSPDPDKNDPSTADNVDEIPDPSNVRPRATRQSVVSEFGLPGDQFELTCSRLERVGLCDVGMFVFPTRLGRSGTGPRQYNSIQLRPLAMALVDACARRLPTSPLP